jgi:hypothetical protein
MRDKGGSQGREERNRWEGKDKKEGDEKKRKEGRSTTAVPVELKGE